MPIPLLPYSDSSPGPTPDLDVYRVVKLFAQRSRFHNSLQFAVQPIHCYRGELVVVDVYFLDQIDGGILDWEITFGLTDTPGNVLIFQKDVGNGIEITSSNSIRITIEESDTDLLDADRIYYFDIWRSSLGARQTIIPVSPFHVQGGVSYN